MRTSQVRLNGGETKETTELSALIAKGLEVFENEEAFRNWLNNAVPALGGQTPHALLGSPLGRRQVLDLLVRIEHGHYS